MSDGQIVTAFEEWRKVHDELSQLRDKLSEIRKKGGWMEGVPTEEGVYHLDVGWCQILVDVYCTSKGEWRVADLNDDNPNEESVPLSTYRSCKFARILTPEDLE